VPAWKSRNQWMFIKIVCKHGNSIGNGFGSFTHHNAQGCCKNSYCNWYTNPSNDYHPEGTMHSEEGDEEDQGKGTHVHHHKQFNG